MGFITGIFGGAKTNSTQTPAATQLQAQTSAYGKCLTFGFGTNRIAPVLIWYGQFKSHAKKSSGGGGKGGPSNTGSVTYTYTTSVEMALGEGPIEDVARVWKDKNVYNDLAVGQSVGFTLFYGTYSQTAWTYLTDLVTPQNGAITKIKNTLATLAATYYIKSTFTSASGETLASAESTFVLATGNQMRVASPKNMASTPGVTGWNVYVSTSTGVEKKQNASPMTSGQSWTLPLTGLVNLGDLPASDTSNLSQALNYRGIAYVAAENYQLGSSPDLGNHNFEVVWSTDFGNDADASIVVTEILTNAKYGTVFPSANLGDMTTYQDYIYSAGLFISPFYTDQQPAADMVDEIAKLTNTGIVFTEGKLKFIPYGDQNLTANGHTYTAPSAVISALTDDDFMPNQTASGSAGGTASDPVLVTRMDASQNFNSLRLEYLNRDNQYAPEIVEAKDQAGIDQNGLLQDGTVEGHIFCLADAAQTSVNLMLGRQAILNTYQFSLDARYIYLDPMDIVPVDDIGLQLDAQWVRIKEITENDDFTLSVQAEEYLQGTGSTVLQDFTQGDGFFADYASDPGETNAPVIFEAPTALTSNGGLETWIAISGKLQNWGGCDVYVSTDGVNYILAANGTNGGRQIGNARTGTLIDDIGSGANTMSVDLSQSRGELESGTAEDAAAGNTLCYVDGELISYQTATLISAYNYELTGCIRGQYGTTPRNHKAGKAFARMDTAIFKNPHSSLQKGQSLSIKLLSFNIYGGGQQSL